MMKMLDVWIDVKFNKVVWSKGICNVCDWWSEWMWMGWWRRRATRRAILEEFEGDDETEIDEDVNVCCEWCVGFEVNLCVNFL